MRAVLDQPAAHELAPDAVFHSPVADYEGRDRIGAVLTAVTQVVAVPRPSHLIEGSDETLLAWGLSDLVAGKAIAGAGLERISATPYRLTASRILAA
jgi:hypothetical protein